MADTCRSAPTDGAFIAYNCPRDSGETSARSTVMPCPAGNNNSLLLRSVYPPRRRSSIAALPRRNSGPKSAKGKKGETVVCCLRYRGLEEIKTCLASSGRYQGASKLLHRHRSCCGQRRHRVWRGGLSSAERGSRKGRIKEEDERKDRGDLRARGRWRKPPEEFNAWMKPYEEGRVYLHATRARAPSFVCDVK